MKKITFLTVVLFLLISVKLTAQEDTARECTIKYNLFKGLQPLSIFTQNEKRV